MSRPVTPHQLHHLLAVAPSIKLHFASEAKLRNYRQMLYTVNKQGEFRYRTQRDGALAIIIMRLK